jgi:hypothetical protein
MNIDWELEQLHRDIEDLEGSLETWGLLQFDPRTGRRQLRPESADVDFVEPSLSPAQFRYHDLYEEMDRAAPAWSDKTPRWQEPTAPARNVVTHGGLETSTYRGPPIHAPNITTRK